MTESVGRAGDETSMLAGEEYALPEPREALLPVDPDMMLDVNLAGELVFPLAATLRARGVPFLFSTGYGPAGLPAEFSSCHVVAKPFSKPELREMLVVAIQAERCLASAWRSDRPWESYNYDQLLNAPLTHRH